MSIIRAAIKLIIRQHTQTPFSGRVLSLGVPEAHATADELEIWFKENGLEPDANVRASAKVTTNPIGGRFGFVSGRSFLEFFGFDRVDCLDVPGCEHPPEIYHDLNNPIDDQHHGKYSFVLDPGTLEHVFDQATCLRNVANVLAVGGTACHLVPVYSYNGGYYSINPNVLHDFYRANGFEIDNAFVIMWDRYKAYSKARSFCYRYDDGIMGSRHAVGDLDQVRYTPHLLLFARKVGNVENYTAPLQFEGNYVAESSSLAETRNQSLETRGKRVANLVYGILPFHVAFYLQAATYRWLAYIRARKVAGFKI